MAIAPAPARFTDLMLDFLGHLELGDGMGQPIFGRIGVARVDVDLAAPGRLGLGVRRIFEPRALIDRWRVRLDAGGNPRRMLARVRAQRGPSLHAPIISPSRTKRKGRSFLSGPSGENRLR